MSALLQPKTMTSDAYLLIATDACHPCVRLHPLGRKKGQLDSGLVKGTRVLKRATPRHDDNDEEDNEKPRKKSRTALTWLNLNSRSSLLTVESMITSPAAWDVSLKASSSEQQGLSTAGENSTEDRSRENTNFAFETNVVNIILEGPQSLRSIRESDEETDGSLSDEDFGLDEPFRIVG